MVTSPRWVWMVRVRSVHPGGSAWSGITVVLGSTPCPQPLFTLWGAALGLETAVGLPGRPGKHGFCRRSGRPCRGRRLIRVWGGNPPAAPEAQRPRLQVRWGGAGLGPRVGRFLSWAQPAPLPPRAGSPPLGVMLRATQELLRARPPDTRLLAGGALVVVGATP